MTDFGNYGVWAGFSAISPDQARQIEKLGYGTIWLGGSPTSLAPVRKLLAGTETVHVATGIAAIWNTDAAEIAKQYRELESDFPVGFCSAWA
ncbi:MULTISPECIES: hypothetical protein [Actinomycetes]|uniref:hypothetical protein n=1 Tax=Actinomycetes TaxID=1760 RepID=UPI000A972820|nr:MULTISPECIES: hypothetical protein [Actinomycetes]